MTSNIWLHPNGIGINIDTSSITELQVCLEHIKLIPKSSKFTIRRL